MLLFKCFHSIYIEVNDNPFCTRDGTNDFMIFLYDSISISLKFS